MKKIFFYTTLFILTSLSSCEKEIKFKDQDSKPRIVLHSFMDGNDTLICIISQSVSVLNPIYDIPKISNAEAKLYENDVFIGDLINYPLAEEGIYYYPNLNPIPGKSYKLIVSHPNFETVESSFILPYPINNLTVDTTRNFGRMNFNFDFTDNSNEQNFYGIMITLRNVELYDNGIGGYDTVIYYDDYMCSKDIIFVNGYEQDNGDKCTFEFLFTDKNLNGSKISFSLHSYITELTDTININLRSYSEGMYKNKISKEKYNQTNGDFFAEPVQVYTNVNNGYGIFGGYSTFQKTIVITP